MSHENSRTQETAFPAEKAAPPDPLHCDTLCKYTDKSCIVSRSVWEKGPNTIRCHPLNSQRANTACYLTISFNYFFYKGAGAEPDCNECEANNK